MTASARPQLAFPVLFSVAAMLGSAAVASAITYACGDGGDALPPEGAEDSDSGPCGVGTGGRGLYIAGTVAGKAIEITGEAAEFYQTFEDAPGTASPTEGDEGATPKGKLIELSIADTPGGVAVTVTPKNDAKIAAGRNPIPSRIGVKLTHASLPGGKIVASGGEVNFEKYETAQVAGKWAFTQISADGEPVAGRLDGCFSATLGIAEDDGTEGTEGTPGEGSEGETPEPAGPLYTCTMKFDPTKSCTEGAAGPEDETGGTWSCTCVTGTACVREGMTCAAAGAACCE